MTELTKKTAAPQAIFASAPDVGIGTPTLPRVRTCAFCQKTGHFVRECDQVNEYVRAGKAMKDVTNSKILLPTGEPIPDGEGSLKTRLDSWLNKMKSFFSQIVLPDETDPAESVTSGIVEITSSVDEHLSPVSVNSHSQTDELKKLVAAIRAEKNLPAKQPMNTRSKEDGNPTEKIGPMLNPDGDKRPAHPVKPTNVDLGSTHADNTRYQNKSKAEDQTLIDELLTMVLDGRLTSIKTSHILAASPIIRTMLMSYLRRQRVEVTQFTQSFDSNINNGRVVGRDSLPLGEIEVLLNNKIPVRGVIDNGSQIITMREDLWRELSHTTLLPRFNMSMEGADSHVSSTKGKLRDLPITVYVQIQVVERSPCKLLLGLPFWGLTNCHLDIYPDGFMTATLTDPNPPGETIVVQSFARNPSRDRAEHNESFLQEIQTDYIELNPPINNEAFPMIGSIAIEDIKSFFD